MSNTIKNNSVDDIIELTEVVSIGSGVGVGADTVQAENDVLDSLVNEFDEHSDSPKATQDDDVLDLSNLDSLISSYHLDFDEDKNSDSQLDSDFDTLLNDIKKEKAADSNAEQDEFSLSDAEKAEGNFFQDAKLLQKQPADADTALDDEIDLLTNDIINGSSLQTDDEILDLAEPLSASDADEKEPEQSDVFLDELDKQLEKTEDTVRLSSQNKTEDFSAADAISEDFAENSFENSSEQLSDDNLKSDMAEEEPEDITDETFNDILNELSLEHENDEEVVPFAQEASSENMPIHLKGEISFLETQSPGKEEDVSLVQSASKVLDSDEAYLEKFSGEDESVGAKLKNLSTSLTSLEQRLLGSDSKWQDTGLELNYRISGMENRLSSLEESSRSDIAALKSSVAKFSHMAEEFSAKLNSAAEGGCLQEKLHVLENRIATLDDIFSEQKMLNDELAKTLDGQVCNGSADGGSVQALEEKIAVLQKELTAAQAKITLLEENIEKAASMAAAKVLREEIIPLLTKE